MEEKLQSIETPYIDAQTLLILFADYRKPREHILRLIKKKELIRLKNGFYLIASKVSSLADVPYEQIANVLYGPSYVSFEWALSFYGMIPERAYTITSATIGKSKEFKTPCGDFSYSTIPDSSYSIGVTQMQAAGFVGGFLIATPEKALADLVYKTCKGLNKEELKNELLESKRIEKENLQQLNKQLLIEICEQYQKPSLRLLIDLVGVL